MALYLFTITAAGIMGLSQGSPASGPTQTDFVATFKPGISSSQMMAAVTIVTAQLNQTYSSVTPNNILLNVAGVPNDGTLDQSIGILSQQGYKLSSVQTIGLCTPADFSEYLNGQDMILVHNNQGQISNLYCGPIDQYWPAPVMRVQQPSNSRMASRSGLAPRAMGQPLAQQAYGTPLQAQPVQQYRQPAQQYIAPAVPTPTQAVQNMGMPLGAPLGPPVQIPAPAQAFPTAPVATAPQTMGVPLGQPTQPVQMAPAPVTNSLPVASAPVQQAPVMAPPGDDLSDPFLK
jgi:hypothetical protein